MTAIQSNMDFMVEESYPCTSHGCDKVFYVKSDLEKHAPVHAEEMWEKNNCCMHILKCTSISVSVRVCVYCKLSCIGSKCVIIIKFTFLGLGGGMLNTPQTKRLKRHNSSNVSNASNASNTSNASIPQTYRTTQTPHAARDKFDSPSTPNHFSTARERCFVNWVGSFFC